MNFEGLAASCSGSRFSPHLLVKASKFLNHQQPLMTHAAGPEKGMPIVSRKPKAAHCAMNQVRTDAAPTWPGNSG